MKEQLKFKSRPKSVATPVSRYQSNTSKNKRIKIDLFNKSKPKRPKKIETVDYKSESNEKLVVSAHMPQSPVKNDKKTVMSAKVIKLDVNDYLFICSFLG